jgi:hypothetical protein
MTLFFGKSLPKNSTTFLSRYSKTCLSFMSIMQKIVSKNERKWKQADLIKRLPSYPRFALTEDWVAGMI